MNKTRLRLDQYLVDFYGYENRSRASDAIRRGCVFVDGKKALKPGQATSVNTRIEIDDPARHYVSRAALKLLHGLEISGFDPDNKIALDLGASTGGFCQVLLERGAKKIYAIDVGQGQLHPKIAHDERVINLENLNARDLTITHFAGVAPQFLTCDLSFISLKPALPPALELAAKDAQAIFLIKPQFEAGREAVGKGGIIRDPALARQTAHGLADWLDIQAGWEIKTLVPSPIIGSDGNREFLLAAQKTADKDER